MISEREFLDELTRFRDADTAALQAVVGGIRKIPESGRPAGAQTVLLACLAILVQRGHSVQL